MHRHKRRGNGDRSFQPGGAGKGDSDRSPKWRDNYHEIEWPDGGSRRLIPGDGFTQRGGKLIKRYGQAETVAHDTAPAAVIH